MTTMLDRWHDHYHVDAPAPIGECVYCDDERKRAIYMRVNGLESTGYQELMSEFRWHIDSYDLWGSVMEWLFAIADARYLTFGELMPGYRPGLALESGEIESYPTLVTLDRIATDGVTEEDLIRVFNVLNRWANVLRSMGKDY